jgi:UDP-GlcNAc:undecaprenyl-phosphate GlcNAc-1-phosphate transferase
MPDLTQSFLGITLFSACVSALITGLVVKYGKQLKIIDDPKTHKHAKITHSTPVPRGGGLPIFFALISAVLIFYPTNARIWGVVVAAAFLAAIGFIDDRFEEKVSPYVRLIVNALAAIIVIATGVGIAYINNPLGGIIHLDQPQFCMWILGETRCLWILSDVFALVWLMWMQNVVGWSSGVDGQLPGFVVIAAAAMGILSLRFASDPNQLPAIILSAIVVGAYVGFLPWNWYPQKIIPGYGGKSLAGFLLGVLAILSVAKVGALILVLGIPFIDGVLVILKRLREKRSPFMGGREHLHHYLLDRGWGRRRIALFYWGISGILAVLALRLQASSKYFTMAAVSLVIAAIILWLQYFSTSSKQPDLDNG